MKKKTRSKFIMKKIFFAVKKKVEQKKAKCLRTTFNHKFLLKNQNIFYDLVFFIPAL